MNRLLLCIPLLLAPFAPLLSQGEDPNWKIAKSLGDQYVGMGKYGSAAERYATAFAAKPDKLDLAELSAEYYLRVKAYRSAAKMLEALTVDPREYPLAKLKLARALKQSGSYKGAVDAYQAFIFGYTGDDKEELTGLVEDEIRGAVLARQELTLDNPLYAVEPMSKSINTIHNELGPMPLASNVLYFLSDRVGAGDILRRTEENGTWADPGPTDQFPELEGKRIGSGALGPDGSRFYFSLCDDDTPLSDPTTRCEIHVIMRRDSGWSDPIALPNYINVPDQSASQPYVYQEGNNEVLLFASDRKDGRGGMDIWRSERPVQSGATDFSFPENLGDNVNGIADEVTPYYDVDTKTLSFASNGFINLGGYDIFHAQSMGNGRWSSPSNPQAPINSSGDDYYYRGVPGTRKGYFASNRTLEVPFSTDGSSDENIFEVEQLVKQVPISVSVVDSTTGQPLPKVIMTVYGTQRVDSRKLYSSIEANDGGFVVQLPVDEQLELEVRCDGYQVRRTQLRVPASQESSYTLPALRLQELTGIVLANASPGTVPSDGVQPSVGGQASAVNDDVAPAVSRATGGATEAPAPNPPTAVRTSQSERTNTPKPDAPSATTANRTFRIQLEESPHFEPEAGRYTEVQTLGQLTSEYSGEDKLHKVFVGNYGTSAEVLDALKLAREAGWPNAYVVQFENAVYRGQWQGN